MKGKVVRAGEFKEDRIVNDLFTNTSKSSANVKKLSFREKL